MDYRKLVIAAFAFAIISLIVHTIGAFASMGYYTNPAYFSMWSSLMMPGPSPPGWEFYATSFAVALITGAIFAYIYGIMKVAFAANPKKNFKRPTPTAIGLEFAALMFLAVSFTSAMSSWLLFSFPLGLQCEWLAEGFAIFMLFGVALGRIYG
ncbi:MAG: hypothetical protein NTX79_06670 [Candidatus Micrarchaeota archaeon]|nr:hypothetical protein [Candidatus Micrarchaeota archaeon]